MNISGKYLKVWKKEEGPNYIKLDLGEGEKRYQSEEYDNWTWFGCFLAGNARNVIVNEGDKVEIKSGKISMRKYNDRWSPSITIFELEVMQPAQQGGYSPQTPPPQQQSQFPDDIPF